MHKSSCYTKCKREANYSTNYLQNNLTSKFDGNKSSFVSKSVNSPRLSDWWSVYMNSCKLTI